MATSKPMRELSWVGTRQLTRQSLIGLRRSSTMVLLSAVCVLTACGGPGSQTAASPGSKPDGPQPAAPKRLTAAVMAEPASLSNGISFGVANVPGVTALERLVNSGLSVRNDSGALRPLVGEAVPSVENGLWQIFPDGRMETTWRIRESARWHDGNPLTADDLVFAATVGRDPDLPGFGHVAYNSVESLRSVDPRTVTVNWRRPYIDADAMFTSALAYPLPRHLLEQSYREEKASFRELRYWTHDYIGLGPFRVRQWEGGSHAIFSANDSYVLGRPKIDEIEVKFIPDPNTLIANVLAGAVELTLGRSVSIEQGIQVRELWKEGQAQIDSSTSGWIVIFPQNLAPNPVVVGDARFRRALLHAVDRQQLVDGLLGGLTAVGHNFILPDEPEYRDIGASLPRYDYDPRRALQIIEGLGYARGADGMLRDAANQRLDVEFRAVATDIAQKAMFATADYWQQVGVSVERIVIPAARQGELEYRATFPAFQLFNQGNTTSYFQSIHSSRTPLPATNYVGMNYARHMDPEFDALIDRYFATIPRRERADVVKQILFQIFDQLHVLMPLFYNGAPTLVGNRLQGITSGTWNAHEWEIRN